MSHVDHTCGHILIPIHQLAGGQFPLIKGFQKDNENLIIVELLLNKNNH